jgi:anti-sigma factor RsiW
MSTADGLHDEWEPLLHGYADGELDAANALKVEEHLDGCSGCAARLGEIKAQQVLIAQDGVRWPASDALRSRLSAALQREIAAPQRQREPVMSWRLFLDRFTRWSLLPSAAVLATCLLFVTLRPGPGPSLEDQLVSSHVHSLLANHLTDVLTSDQHTVKPWFNGKIDFSPPVVDLKDKEFPLVGGRIDYLNGRVVATLIYRRGKHVINLFIWPSSGSATPAAEREGYNLLNWTQAGLDFWAVSDVNPADLKEFQQDFVEETSK